MEQNKSIGFKKPFRNAQIFPTDSKIDPFKALMPQKFVRKRQLPTHRE
jgi:hypothetical protein